MCIGHNGSRVSLEYLRVFAFGTSIRVLGVNCVTMTSRYRWKVLVNKISSSRPARKIINKIAKTFLFSIAVLSRKENISHGKH